MSTFYVLPSRHELGKQFAEALALVFPGLNWPSSTWSDLAETLATTTGGHIDVFVVFRDDLPDGLSAAAGLSEACGAEAGDDVVEVLPGTRLGATNVRRWRIATERTAAA
jgi:hypothetical protein